VRLSSWPAGVCCALTALSWASCHRPFDAGPPPGAGSDNPPGKVDVCTKNHGAWATSFVHDPSCPIDYCGLNGSWLGSGVRFRTLHINGGANPQGLRIKAFHSGSTPPVKLNLDVVGQELLGRTPSGPYQGAQLNGAQIILTQPAADPGRLSGVGIPDTTYTLTITDVRTADFWSECKADEDCTAAPDQVNFYKFNAVSSDGCEIELCKPGLADGYDGGLSGTAVIFRGDYYDDDGYTVRATPPSPADSDVFNIACLGSAISKLHLLRLTTAGGHVTNQNTVKLRQAMLKLLTADYCGAGVPFTQDGIPVDLGFKSLRWRPSVASQYRLHGPDAVDALWTDTGASCLGVPRMAKHGWAEPELRAAIASTCSAHSKPSPPACAVATVQGTGSAPGSMALSATP
jgi:hypothetical protein